MVFKFHIMHRNDSQQKTKGIQQSSKEKKNDFSGGEIINPSEAEFEKLFFLVTALGSVTIASTNPLEHIFHTIHFHFA